MKILLGTDAWHPQINGVVRTLESLCREVSKLGSEIYLVTPANFRTFPSPANRTVRLALFQPRRLLGILRSLSFDYVHIATEGAVGLMLRQYCLDAGSPFTTSYHTRLPECVALQTPIPQSWVYRFERWFHGPALGTMVHSPSLSVELSSKGFRNLLPWCRGVDRQLFSPRKDRRYGDTGPVYLYVGRLTVEKNVADFLELGLPGKKVVVGDGPLLRRLRYRYPEAIFTGWLTGDALASAYSSADVLVFPSKTDVFSNVALEALACGTPVAAYPVPGIVDVTRGAPVCALSENLTLAVEAALTLDRQACSEFAMAFSPRIVAQQFLDHIRQVHSGC
ncbi:glycosyltransferase family 4 protein [Rhizobium ruizarguesonis]|uniref:glycosyltransferase family 4 protein n=1 Tax=Rhizobium ruizarguesonis TaxID=2081791 RepID=UPI00048205E2|nr:glycosyltransferase family 1 protein [Rhizobium ruizarguesonis]QJS31298.1 glycosyltransferase family 1 protein [Rhizobium leguminosarum bv. trifolii TA1]TAW02680.1 glycosyltransferase family 1 protein [Rhizobium ruizarguesonis]TAZ44249.1 glycosyltransferase family 1 protein [Rhizobium ruizarguesonis]TBB35877.1 glycosyltransferase family 1 protein [Rhizobium ruizarguesonis]UFW98111.1 glycosyltransferase family 1 protein [Rhizobium ruizarguesonis]